MGGRNADRLVLGDVDGDGDLDVVQAATGYLEVRLNDGSGNFSAGLMLSVGSLNARQLVLADFDSDSDLDLLVADGSTHTTQSFLNDGSGTFAAGPSWSSSGSPPSVAASDIDLDVVFGNGNTPNVVVRRRAGTATFTTDPDVPTTSGAGYVVLADVDADGDLDLLAALGDDTLGVYLNDGTGAFAAPATAPALPPGASPTGLALADLDGDGDLDAVVGNSGSNTVSLLLNQPTAPLPVQLVVFEAERRGSTVALAWRTASEVNSARFEVERSADGVSFVRIGQVAAQGTKATATDYAFADTWPLVALSYYRLRQVDPDGTAAFSPVRAVTFAAPVAALTAYPVPARASQLLTVTGAPAGTPVEVFDAVGRRLATAIATPDGTATLSLHRALASGVYVLRSTNGVCRLVVVE